MASRDMEIRRLTGNVRYAGVNQVWGEMCKGWVNEYRHESWYDEMTYQWFPRGLVPWTRPADNQRDIVLSVYEFFERQFVKKMYEFLVSLTRWWTPPAKFLEHSGLPKYQRMQYIICLWEHEVQNNFDVRDVRAAVQTCNEIGRVVRNTAKTPGLLKRLTELSLYLEELDQFLSGTEELVAPSLQETVSERTITDSLLLLKSQCLHFR